MNDNNEITIREDLTKLEKVTVICVGKPVKENQGTCEEAMFGFNLFQKKRKK